MATSYGVIALAQSVAADSIVASLILIAFILRRWGAWGFLIAHAGSWIVLQLCAGGVTMPDAPRKPWRSTLAVLIVLSIVLADVFLAILTSCRVANCCVFGSDAAPFSMGYPVCRLTPASAIPGLPYLVCTALGLSAVIGIARADLVYSLRPEALVEASACIVFVLLHIYLLTWNGANWPDLFIFQTTAVAGLNILAVFVSRKSARSAFWALGLCVFLDALALAGVLGFVGPSPAEGTESTTSQTQTSALAPANAVITAADATTAAVQTGCCNRIAQTASAFASLSEAATGAARAAAAGVEVALNTPGASGPANTVRALAVAYSRDATRQGEGVTGTLADMCSALVASFRPTMAPADSQVLFQRAAAVCGPLAEQLVGLSTQYTAAVNAALGNPNRVAGTSRPVFGYTPATSTNQALPPAVPGVAAAIFALSLFLVVLQARAILFRQVPIVQVEDATDDNDASVVTTKGAQTFGSLTVPHNRRWALP